MPRMTGDEAIKRLRADPEWSVLPIVVLSTSDSERQILQAYHSGANAFMTKPGHFDEFVDLIRSFSAFWLGVAKLPLAPSPV